ncbi:hypothetical protein ACFWC5_21570 [Streptomyces sp. NPDC060085]|uniref:hypothetical protein n=1 Tax=Streptomyces sp. NPDC060085 TaxID=3347054 RepID=UPI003663F563
MVGLVAFFAFSGLFAWDAQQKREVAAAAQHQAVKPMSPAEQTEANAKLAHQVVMGTTFVCVLSFTAFLSHGVITKLTSLKKGSVNDGEQVVTEALDLVPALARLLSAPAGRKRVEALTQVHAKGSALASAVSTSTNTAGGLAGRYTADRGRLREHGQKVRTVLTEKIGELVEDRERATRELGTLTLTVAGRQAQAAYGALLDASALPADPGPEIIDVKALRPVFILSGGAALLALCLAPTMGAQGVGLFFVPAAAFALCAFLTAAFTRNLHQLGRVFAIFGRGGNGGSGGGV